MNIITEESGTDDRSLTTEEGDWKARGGCIATFIDEVDTG